MKKEMKEEMGMALLSVVLYIREEHDTLVLQKRLAVPMCEMSKDDRKARLLLIEAVTELLRCKGHMQAFSRVCYSVYINIGSQALINIEEDTG